MYSTTPPIDAVAAFLSLIFAVEASIQPEKSPVDSVNILISGVLMFTLIFPPILSEYLYSYTALSACREW